VLARAREAGVAVEPAALIATADLAALTTDLEWGLALRLAEVGDVVQRAAAAAEPHTVARYLIDLAGDYSRWYTAGNGDPALRVLSEDPALRAARLALLAATREVLRLGLGLLGLSAPDQM
jgi:arginyl-tRNA synthetase